MSKILLKIVKGAIHLKNDRKETKVIIEEVEKELDGLGIVKAVHRFVFSFLEFFIKKYQSRFYELSSQYYQMEGDHGAYYRNSLKYLGVTDLSKMDQQTQGIFAWHFRLVFSLCFIKNLFNFEINIWKRAVWNNFFWIFAPNLYMLRYFVAELCTFATEAHTIIIIFTILSWKL